MQTLQGWFWDFVDWLRHVSIRVGIGLTIMAVVLGLVVLTTVLIQTSWFGPILCVLFILAMLYGIGHLFVGTWND